MPLEVWPEAMTVTDTMLLPSVAAVCEPIWLMIGGGGKATVSVNVCVATGLIPLVALIKML